MGKGRDKKKKSKDSVKKEEKKNKQSEKVSKKQKSKLKCEDEEDIEVILDNFRKQQEAKYKVCEELCADPPSPRINGTLVANAASSELILFGGEYFNGDKCVLNNDLFRYNAEKFEWKKITSPNTPGPRSSHQAIIANNAKMYIFGGEFASASETQFFHYKDFWSLDLKTFQWERLDCKPMPSARSGHRMALWKNFIVLFGGFYDNYIETKYYDDLWIFDIQNGKWNKIEIADICKPSARSGFVFIPYEGGIVLHGGYYKKYSKKDKAQGLVLNDTWLLRMSSQLNQIKWEKRKKSGMCPSARCGMSAVAFKNKAVVFGGVYDEELSDEQMKTTCYNDMFWFHLDSNKWFSVALRSSKSKASKEKQREMEESSDSELDVVQLAEMEEIGKSIVQDEKIAKPSFPLLTQFPCPRYNPMMAVLRNTLFILGGVFEYCEREYTLDDFYCINLEKMDGFTCFKECQMDTQEWIEPEESEGESDEDDEDGEDEEDDEDDSEDSSSNESQVEECEEIVAHDQNVSPLLGESLKDYFARTSAYWTEVALRENESRGKALRRDAFEIAKEYYQSIQPLLAQMTEMQVDSMSLSKVQENTGYRSRR